MSESYTHTTSPVEEKPRVISASALPDCRLPAPGDIVTMVEWSGGTTITFEPSAIFAAKHMIAEPSRLIKWAVKIAWYDLKLVVQRSHKRPLETVRDALDRISGSHDALEIEALGWLSSELATRADGWSGNAPTWFPEPPEWLELWREAKAAVTNKYRR